MVVEDGEASACGSIWETIWAVLQDVIYIETMAFVAPVC